MARPVLQTQYVVLCDITSIDAISTKVKRERCKYFAVYSFEQLLHVLL
jgi:hypothetical protein